MSDINTEIATNTNKDRRRSARPERIWIGGKEMVRNDIVAREQGGVTERAINRGDAKGAPYIIIGGVKYRPIEQYHQFLLGQVQVRNQPPTKRRGHR
jgi:hypothetical protein